LPPIHIEEGRAVMATATQTLQNFIGGEFVE
jgi:hypothetical protein